MDMTVLRDALPAIAESSPFAFVVTIAIIVLSRQSNKHIKLVKEMYESAIENIRKAYDDSIAILRSADK